MKKILSVIARSPARATKQSDTKCHPERSEGSQRFFPPLGPGDTPFWWVGAALRMTGRDCFALLAMTLLICTSVLLAGSKISFSEEIPMRIDGTVISADEEHRKLSIDFEHPATGEHVEKEFMIREGAGFKDFKKLSELKKGDLVSLDYIDTKPTLTAIYVMHIPLEKTYFTHKEIAQAFVQIKLGPKNENAAKN